MNNNSSPSFATVFFVIALFIGMGVLGYHTYELNLEKRQLEETVGTLQASEATLKTENAALKAENKDLKTENKDLEAENAALTGENSQLKSELVKAMVENASMEAAGPVSPIELEALRLENSNLRLENQRLQTQQGSGSNNEAAGALQSTFLPTDLKFWVKLAMIILVEVFLFASYKVGILLRDMRRKRAAIPNEVHGGRISSRKGRYHPIVDSRFINR